MPYNNIPSVTKENYMEITVYLDDFDYDDIMSYVKNEHTDVFDILDELVTAVDLNKKESEIVDIVKRLVESYRQI